MGGTCPQLVATRGRARSEAKSEEGGEGGGGRWLPNRVRVDLTFHWGAGRWVDRGPAFERARG